jgi:hypothetical protein
MALRISFGRKYELEESTSQIPPVAENDDNNPSGQSTVQVSQTGEEGYEPAEEVKPSAYLKKMQAELEDGAVNFIFVIS